MFVSQAPQAVRRDASPTAPAAGSTDRADLPAPPERQVEVTGGQGHYVGDHGVVINLFGGSRPEGPVVAGNVPQAPAAFQPREDLMAKLLRHQRETHEFVVFVPVADDEMFRAFRKSEHSLQLRLRPALEADTVLRSKLHDLFDRPD